MEEHEGDGTLTWSVIPWAAQRAKGTSALAVVAAAIYGSFVWGGPVMGFLAVLVLVGGVGSFFVKTTYHLDSRTVSVRSPFQRVTRPWDAFRKAYVGDQGVSLSPFAGRHFLEPYRSVMLRYGDHRDEILDWVRRFGPPLQGAGASGERDEREP